MPEIRWYGRGPPRLQGQEDDMQNTAVGQRCLHAFKTRVLRSRGRDSSPNLCTSRTIHVPYIREKDPERRSRRESPLSPRVPYASCSGSRRRMRERSQALMKSSADGATRHQSRGTRRVMQMTRVLIIQRAHR
ncbi:uncharacterized protein LOC143511982 isoform X7 [Brachyhypopomus gauderio]|uniref:uncharacterized protein LOC143511982 isoform X7 n=1 Tax=Brachyhypopomus gauderio TaxID=698409 RepID=UPI0040424D49